MRWLKMALATGLLAPLAACYYQPEYRRGKADSSYLSEAEAERLISKKLEAHGVKFVYNMKLKREGGVEFVADGYDPDLRVGFEYRSHEGMDFEGQRDQAKTGLTDTEIETLLGRQKTFREFFLIVPEGPRDEVEESVDRFVQNLYAWEVLKKAKEQPTKDDLFPDQPGAKKDMLPWETTGDLQKKRKEMEVEEKARLEQEPIESGSSGDEWGTPGGEPSGEDEGVSLPKEVKPEKKPPKKEEPPPEDTGSDDLEDEFR